MDSPGNNSGAPEDRPERHREKDIDTETISAPAPFAKRLLEQWGTIGLFEVREGRRIRYVVEHGERRWEFGILFSARGKFERVAAKQGYCIERQEGSNG